MLQRSALRPEWGPHRLRVHRLVVATGLTILLGGCSGARDAGQAGSSAGVPRKLSTQLVRDPEARDGDRIFAVAFGCESLLEIDPTTRKVRSIGHIGFKFGGIEDVALDPAGKPIVVYWEGYPALLRINLETGVATLGPKIHGHGRFIFDLMDEFRVRSRASGGQRLKSRRCFQGAVGKHAGSGMGSFPPRLASVNYQNPQPAPPQLNGQCDPDNSRANDDYVPTPHTGIVKV